MTTTIRLKRHGTKKKPHMRLVVCDNRFPRDGRFIEQLGTYDPSAQPAKIVLKKERISHWLKMGAKPSQTVKSILKKQGVSKD